MAGEMGRAMAGGCLRGLLVQLLFVGLALMLLALCGGLVAVAPVSADDRPLLGLVAMTTWMGAVFVGVLVFAVVNRWRIARRVDAAFASLGLRGEGQMSIGRQAHGQWQGRQLDAYFSKGPSLELILQARAGTRVAVAPADGLVRAVQAAFGRDRFEPAWPELQGCSVSAADGAWAQALLQDPQARAALAALLDPGRVPALRVAYVQPGAVQLLVRGPTLAIVSAEGVQRAAEALLQLAQAVERAAPPAQWMEPSALEARLRARRPGSTLVLAIVFGTLIFGAIGMLGSGLLMVALHLSQR